MSKVFRYDDTHPSENTTSITLHQADTHSQKKCDTPYNKIVGAVITVDPVKKCLDILTHTLMKMLNEKFQTYDH